MKTAVFTSSSYRHRAFAWMCCDNPALNVELTLHEKQPDSSQTPTQDPLDLTVEHLLMRQISEEDFFRLYLTYRSEIPPVGRYVERGWISTEKCLADLRSRGISQILVYGTSILKGPILKEYQTQILNLHLGLSPYYRGSGTNYFPFVNNSPEYCGATIMYIDSGIDTGPIIHQLRPKINITDTFHQLSNRFLIDAFKEYIRIAEINLMSVSPLPAYATFATNTNQTRQLYRRKDFTESTVRQLYANFSSRMIQDYLESYESRNYYVPIITYLQAS